MEQVNPILLIWEEGGDITYYLIPQCSSFHSQIFALQGLFRNSSDMDYEQEIMWDELNEELDIVGDIKATAITELDITKAMTLNLSGIVHTGMVM